MARITQLVNNARRDQIDCCATEAVREIAEALRRAHADTAYGDESAKECLALACMALDRFRRVLDGPVLAPERHVSRSLSTMPASLDPQPVLPESLQ